MKVAFVITGSFCNMSRTFEILKILATKHEIIPIVSNNVATTDSRFGKAVENLAYINEICGTPAIASIASAEPVGPIIQPDVMIVCPCTGNTLSKVAHGISDTPATLAIKSHLRNNRPLLIALCSNDALSGNFKNIATLHQRKNVYFVPMRQDDVKNKPASLVSEFSLIEKCLDDCIAGKQNLPLFLI